MNNINIYGRLARAPEAREYAKKNGEPGKLCNFTVAVNRSFGEETDFFRCIIFGKRAEVIEKYFAKGSRIVVSGEMQCDPYEEKDGTKKYPWVLMVKDFDFVETAKEGHASTASSTASPADSFEQIDEEVPF